MYRIIVGLLIIQSLTSCHQNTTSTNQETYTIEKNQYAENIMIKHNDNFTLIEIHDT